MPGMPRMPPWDGGWRIPWDCHYWIDMGLRDRELLDCKDLAMACLVLEALRPCMENGRKMPPACDCNDNTSGTRARTRLWSFPAFLPSGRESRLCTTFVFYTFLETRFFRFRYLLVLFQDRVVERRWTNELCFCFGTTYPN